MKSSVILLISLVSLILIFPNIQIVKGVFTGDIHGNTYINEDGSIEPSDAPIQRTGEIFTITDDFHGYHLRIERSDIIVDGNGFTLYQSIILHHVSNVIIKNFFINNPEGSGIDLDHSPNNTITNNTIWECGAVDSTMGAWGASIFIHGEDSNRVYGNFIKNNLVGVIVYGSPNTVFYDNVFADNQFDVSDFAGLGFGTVPSIARFDNGERGNYWDSYSGNDTNNDGIGDESYIIDENNVDKYPLISPADIPEFPSWTILPLFLIFTLIGVLIKKRISLLN